MEIYVLFGLPGAGKTFVGNILQQHFGYYLYDGDISLPNNMKGAIQTKAVITDAMRDIFFQNIIKSSRQLKIKYKKIVVIQTFIKEKYRMQFLKEIPEARFILVQTKKTIREKRLMQRKEYPLDLKYARKMSLNFDTPQIDYDTISNDIDGETNIKQQLQLLLNKR